MSILHPYSPDLGSSVAKAPTGPRPLTDEDLTWIAEYPALEVKVDQRGRLIRRGLLKRTYAGVTYGLAPAEHLGPLTRLGWSPITAGGTNFPPIKIIGDPTRPDETTCDSILLLGYGEPILGTEGNGRRLYKIHLDIQKRTGLIINPSPSDLNGTKVTDEMVAAARAQSHGKQAQAQPK